MYVLQLVYYDSFVIIYIFCVLFRVFLLELPRFVFVRVVTCCLFIFCFKKPVICLLLMLLLLLSVLPISQAELKLR